MFSFEDAYPVSDRDQWANRAASEFPGQRWRRYASVEQAGWSEAALADAQRYSQEIGSAAVMIVFGGAVLAHWGRIERRYKCHSMRKSFLSAIFGEHVARGTIDLEETLDLIGIDDATPLTETEKTARVGDLLKSRSGIYLPAAYEAPKAKRSGQRAAAMSPAVTGITTIGISTPSQRSSIERPAQMSFQSSRDSLQCPSRWKTSSQGTATIILNRRIRFILPIHSECRRAILQDLACCTCAAANGAMPNSSHRLGSLKAPVPIPEYPRADTDTCGGSMVGTWENWGVRRSWARRAPDVHSFRARSLSLCIALTPT